MRMINSAPHIFRRHIASLIQNIVLVIGFCGVPQALILKQVIGILLQFSQNNISAEVNTAVLN
jgi:hypothetical protein